MQRSEFSYDLPEELIAQAPPPERSAGRLLCLDGSTGALQDRMIVQFPDLLRTGDLLILNDTRVIAARLDAKKQTGGRAEVLIERVVEKNRARCLIRASRAPRIDSWLVFDDGSRARVLARDDDLFDLRFEKSVMNLLDVCGHVPLPPYINREDTDLDNKRYQTVFACKPGAVAAPTAGLHFDQEMLNKIAQGGVAIARLTLHVGAGTFQPVRCEDIRDHKMHAEQVELSPDLVAEVAQCRQRGGRVIAVGTTVVRSLETGCQKGELHPYTGESRLFIYPGYRFQCVDAMLTNFHLPESTLLMLVSAFAGREHILNAYHHAVEERYRFFSYGDAMFITPNNEART